MFLVILFPLVGGIAYLAVGRHRDTPTHHRAAPWNPACWSAAAAGGGETEEEWRARVQREAQEQRRHRAQGQPPPEQV